MPADKNEENIYSEIETVDPIKYTILPRQETLIMVKTIPDAVCYLYRENDSASDHILKLYADQNGFVSFHIRPESESEFIAKVILHCNTEKKALRIPIDLRSSFESTKEMPFPNNDELKKQNQSQNNATLLPALTDSEAENLTDKELLERGYAPRPNPKESLEAFKAWMKIFSKPLTIIEPHLVTNEGVKASANKSMEQFHDSNRTWSGYVLRGNVKRDQDGNPIRDKDGNLVFQNYDLVEGAWNVPSVTGELNNLTHSLLWVGLDGWGHDDLVQAGTGQDGILLEFKIPPPTPRSEFFTVSTYFAWTEFLPNQRFMNIVANFAVNPGDEMYVGVWMGDVKTNPDLNGPNGVFYIFNVTTGQVTVVTTARKIEEGNVTIVSGTNAEWIMETPQFYQGFPADLANYDTATIYSANASPAGESGRRRISYQADGNLQVTMVNGVNKLSSVAPIDPQSMRFTWHSFY